MISDAFHRLNLVERAGTGIKRMRVAMSKKNLPEPIIQADSFFSIKLQRQAVSTNVLERSIRVLQERGVVKRIGPDKGGSWEVTSQ